MIYVEPHRCRHGISFVEVLVGIVIIVVLLAMLFPAVQTVRESARRTSCINNQRQIVLACQNYETGLMVLPRGVYVPNGMASNKPVEMFTWMGDVETFMDSPVGEIIQHGEQDTLADVVNLQGEKAKVALTTPQPWMRCPSDSGAPEVNDRRASQTDFGNLPTSHYVAANNVGVCHALRDARSRLAPNGAFNGIESESDASVEDGLSNTVFFSERIYGSFKPDGQPASAALAFGCRGVGSPAVPSRPGIQDATFAAAGQINRFEFSTDPALAQHGVSSGHYGGVVMGFGDGSAKFVKSDIDSFYRNNDSVDRPDKADYGVWERLIDINDGEPLGQEF